MSIAKAKRPFQRLDTLLVLKPRDVFWMTLIALAQGRDDVLIFRSYLSTPPLLDLELADPKDWSGRNALRQAAKRGWETTDFLGLRLMARDCLNLRPTPFSAQCSHARFSRYMHSSCGAAPDLVVRAVPDRDRGFKPTSRP
jgi:hypothetical protein